MNCCSNGQYGNQGPISEWSELISTTDLTPIQKQAISTRVLSVVKRLRNRLSRLTIGYTCLRTSTTVGSLLVPSLLAVQSNVDQTSAYWAMWGIGLLVSLSNAFVSLFRVDKNYFTVGDLIEKIESESWMFLTLSGRYRGDELQEAEEGITGHQSQFTTFMERCETMMNKAIMTEYIPGQMPTSGRSVDQHSLMGKRISHARRQAVPLSEDPYETVPAQIDDKHNRSVGGSGSSNNNVRKQSVGSDSTIESDHRGGIPIGGSQPGMVPTTSGFEGIPIQHENLRLYGHDGKRSKE